MLAVVPGRHEREPGCGLRRETAEWIGKVVGKEAAMGAVDWRKRDCENEEGMGK